MKLGIDESHTNNLGDLRNALYILADVEGMGIGIWLCNLMFEYLLFMRG